jgi:hypothetical protein
MASSPPPSRETLRKKVAEKTLIPHSLMDHNYPAPLVVPKSKRTGKPDDPRRRSDQKRNKTRINIGEAFDSWRERGKVSFILDVGYSTHSKNLFSTGYEDEFVSNQL